VLRYVTSIVTVTVRQTATGLCRAWAVRNANRRSPSATAPRESAPAVAGQRSLQAAHPLRCLMDRFVYRKSEPHHAFEYRASRIVLAYGRGAYAMSREDRERNRMPASRMSDQVMQRRQCVLAAAQIVLYIRVRQ